MEQFIMNTRIYMGAGSLEKFRDLEIERAYIICDPFMKQSGKADCSPAFRAGGLLGNLFRGGAGPDHRRGD